MSTWPRYPRIYEINTWVWLTELREKFGARIDLGSIPASVWDGIAEYGFDAVWLMGVWERSPTGIAIANRNRNLVADFRKTLPDFVVSDNVGSPYCIRRYVADKRFGGRKGLAIARSELATREMHLILDFVPNHVAPDHPWVQDHPDYFIPGTADEARTDPPSAIESGPNIYACGRDPYFPPWPDVVQLNAFQSNLRQAVIETLNDITSQCDAVRCDMAMLMLNKIFERTWGSRAGVAPATDYWAQVIPQVKQSHPSVNFIAEAYWDLEWELQKQGFDFCYDKRLYDRLRQDSAENVRLHLDADIGYQSKLLRFIENHDEDRAAAVFSQEKERAAAVTISTVPGAKLFHDGQFEGRKIKLPVFLGRRPKEPVDQGLQSFYKQLLKKSCTAAFRDGEWSLCPSGGWPDNQSCRNLLAWTSQKNEEQYLTIVNFSGNPAQGRVQVHLPGLKGHACRLVDTLSNASYQRVGDEMLNPGLYVDLGPWQYNCFSISPVAAVNPLEKTRKDTAAA
jgi:glycosidase